MQCAYAGVATASHATGVKLSRLARQLALVHVLFLPREVEAGVMGDGGGRDAVAVTLGLAQCGVTASRVHHQAIVHEVRVDGAADKREKEREDVEVALVSLILRGNPYNSM